MYTTDDNNLPILHLPYVNPDQRMIAMKTMFLQEAVKAPVQGSEASGEEEEEDEGQMFDVIKSFHPRFVEQYKLYTNWF